MSELAIWLIVGGLAWIAWSVLLAFAVARAIRPRGTQPTPPESSDTPPGGGHR